MESKGLEFEDVLIYNYFQNSKVPDKVWKLLKQLKVEKNYMDSQEFI